MNSVIGTFEVAPWALLATTKTGKGRKGNGNQLRDACDRGHKYVEGSWVFAKDSRGYQNRRCLICRRETQAAYKENTPADKRAMIAERDALRRRERYAAKKLGISVEEYRNGLGDSALKKNPLDSFMVRGAEGKAEAALGFAVEAKSKGKRLKCEADPESYFPPDDTEVSNTTAAEMCAGCPIMVECLTRMKFAAPTKGVMIAGGRVFSDGRLQAK